MASKYNRKDIHYQKAKETGVRSRAYFKLQELNQKCKLIKPGYKIVDLGAWPGSWMEYAAKKTGPKGHVTGIDLVEIEPLAGKNTTLLQGDLYKEETIAEVAATCPQGFDLLMSDMSPKLTGIKESDHAQSAGLAELAIYIASKTLKSGGNLVIKVFKSGDTDELIRSHRKYFTKLQRVGLKSTRKTSNEFYIVGFGFKQKLYLDEHNCCS